MFVLKTLCLVFLFLQLVFRLTRPALSGSKATNYAALDLNAFGFCPVKLHQQLQYQTDTYWLPEVFWFLNMQFRQFLVDVTGVWYRCQISATSSMHNTVASRLSQFSQKAYWTWRLGWLNDWLDVWDWLNPLDGAFVDFSYIYCKVFKKMSYETGLQAWLHGYEFKFLIL